MIASVPWWVIALIAFFIWGIYKIIVAIFDFFNWLEKQFR